MIDSIRRLWASSLRSGVNDQITGRLRDNANGRCCLGDLCDVAQLRWVETSRSLDDEERWGILGDPAEGIMFGTLPVLQLDILQLSDGAQNSFTALNDTDKLTFTQIADFIDYGWVPRVPHREEYGIDGEFKGVAIWSRNRGDLFEDNGIEWYVV